MNPVKWLILAVRVVLIDARERRRARLDPWTPEKKRAAVANWFRHTDKATR